MRGICCAKRFCAILLVLICIPLFSLFPNSGGDYAQIMDMRPENVSVQGAKQDAWLPTTPQGAAAVFFVQYAEIALRFSNEQQNSRETVFSGFPYSLFFLLIPCFMFLSNRRKPFKFNRHMVVPHSSHAPPLAV